MSGKRKRERDRPKAAPDALYNPNKRVLLTYESEGEVDDGAIAAKEDQAPLRPVTKYAQEEEQQQSRSKLNDEDKASGNGQDGDFAGADEEVEDWDDEHEESHTNEAGLWLRPTVKNNSTGQWAAIGSLSYQYEDDYDEEEEFASEEEEAMAYLRSVRSERQGMPDFFVAQKVDTDTDPYENGIGDRRGYFEDGAYVAAPRLGPTIPDDAKTHIEPQEAFAAALKARFLKQRQQMHVKPSTKVLASLDKKHPTSLPKNHNQSIATWLRLLAATTPSSNHVRCMEQAGVVRVLELIQKRFLKLEQDIPANLSAWIWSLLARLDDVGTMDSDRIAALRDFGKRAVLVHVSFRDPEAAKQLELAAMAEQGIEPPKHKINDDSKPGKVNDVGDDSSKAAADSKIASTAISGNIPDADEESRRTNTLATLDTIIVLIAEIFGQRDLLEFRQPWKNDEG